MQPEQSLDITKLKYALYARKSTDDEGRQVRSIGDQISDCEKLAKELGIRVSKPYIEEKKSAKNPNKRPLFTQLLKDIRANKYQGILCWHPDRLARNMVEAGQVIDMLDNGTIQDLRFVSHQFSNDANGKMLLGMLFVFSKHYSDDLSQKVSRGVQGNLDDGLSSGTPKHGYIRNKVSGIYEPDPKTHRLIQQAWQMRSEDIEIKDIVSFLDDRDYKKSTQEGRNIKASVNGLSKMFQDPFYYGILVQAGQTVDLREAYNFIPATTIETYNLIQDSGYKKKNGSYRLKKNRIFFPLRQFVHCSYCDKKMSVSKSQPRDKKALPKVYYRCTFESCPRDELKISRGMRAKELFAWVQNFLETDFKAIANEYDRYSKLIDEQSDVQRVRIRTQIHSKSGALGHIRAELDTRAMALVKLPEDSPTQRSVLNKIEALESESQELEDAISKLKDKLTDKSKMKLNKEEFLNLIEKASDKMRAGNAVQKDQIVRIIFLNLKVGDQKVVSYLCNEPFASMLRLAEISSGRGDRI